MSTLNPITDKYAAAAEEYKNAYNTYMGSTGLKSATDYAQSTALENAKQSALSASQTAGSQAQIQARNAGLTKAQAAQMGANAGSTQYGSSFGNAYNNLYSQGLSGALGNYKDTASMAQENLKIAQDEGQAEYDRTMGLINSSVDNAGKINKMAGESNTLIGRLVGGGKSNAASAASQMPTLNRGGI